MTMAATNPTAWATLKYDPKQVEGKFGTDWMVTATINDKDERLYYQVGSTLDHLRRGDTVFAEYSKGRWRVAKSQPPELNNQLIQRGQSAAPPAPGGPPPASPSAPVELTAEQKRAIAAYIDALSIQYKGLYNYCFKVAQAQMGDDQIGCSTMAAVLFQAALKQL